MGTERSSGLAMLHIDHSESVDIDAVLKQFDMSGHRRIELAFEEVLTKAQAVASIHSDNYASLLIASRPICL